MRSVFHVLILSAVLAGSLAQASPEPDDQDVFGAPGFGPAKAHRGDSRTTVFKVHPLPILGGMALGVFMFPMELEVAVTPNLSVYALGTPLLLASGSAGGVALNGGVRGYFSGQAPDGFWLGAQLGATMLASSSGAGLAGIDLQAQLGYQWVLDSGFTIGLGTGLSITSLAAGKFPVTFVLPLGFAW